jgi:hypothetical protein
MNQKNFDEAVAILQSMVKAEVTLGELYKIYAEIWPKKNSLWSDLALEEIDHAHNIELIIDIFLKAPEHFKVVRPFNIIGLHTFIDGIEAHKKKIQRGDVGELKMLFISKDIEQGIIESKYFDFMTSDHPEYKKIVQTIMFQTNAHRNKIIKMIERMQEK